jgi:hypothetical protein
MDDLSLPALAKEKRRHADIDLQYERTMRYNQGKPDATVMQMLLNVGRTGGAQPGR